MADGYLTSDGVRFLRELGTHNEKAWFEKNKARFEEGVRAPTQRLIADLAPVLEKISPHFVVDLRPNGGSLSRIHRDTRFSKDKSPYKTHLFAHFHHEDGSEECSPGFFLRLGPGESAVGAGVWRPGPAALAKIRAAMVTDAAAWRKAKQKVLAAGGRVIPGEPLKKVPKGFDPEHEHAEDLKHKSVGLVLDLPDAALTSPSLPKEIAERFRLAAPAVRFVCAAVGLDA